VLEGVPWKEKNDEIIERFHRQAAAQYYALPIVIEPVRIPFTLIPNLPGPPREHLPQIVCSARFSSSPIKNERQDCSHLAFLWFQDTWALPIDPAVLQKIQKVDWDAHAVNHTE
jgi:hypothetical protein